MESKNKRNKRNRNKSWIERTDWCLPDGRDLEGLVNKAKGLRSTNWQNIVNNIVITEYGTRWVLDLSRDRFVTYINV